MKLNALLSIVSTFLCWLTFSASCYAQPQSDGYVHDVIQLEDITIDNYAMSSETGNKNLNKTVAGLLYSIEVSCSYNTKWNRNYMRLNTNKHHGFVTTTSKGKAKQVTVKWNKNTSLQNNEHTTGIEIYGKKTPYTSIAEAYNQETRGEKIGFLETERTENFVTVTLSKDYEYIAIVQAINLVAFTSLDIAWQQTDYERSVTSGSLNTLCLPYDAKEIPDGMHVFEVLGKTMDGALPSSIDFTPVDRIEAGIPYVFVNDNDNLHLELQGDEALSTASNRNGLYGTFVKYPFADDDGYNSNYYIINSSSEVQAASSSSGVVANRAFIKMNEVPDLATVQSLPSRRLVLTANGFSIVDGTTSIANATTMTTESNTTYDLSGRMLREIPSSAKGLYIVNGKKVIK